MTTTQVTEITGILNAGTFDYCYCGSTPGAADMEDYLSILNAGTFTEAEVEKALFRAGELEIISEYSKMQHERNDFETIEQYAAHWIADTIALMKTECVYEAVTFTF